MSLNLVFIGAGKLATNLSLAFKEKGYSIQQVYSRTKKSAKTLAEKTGAEYTTNEMDIILGADVYFITLSDSAFETVLPKIKFNNAMIIHCSGSLPLSVLKDSSENMGVLYPLQTFLKDEQVDFSNVPFFVESDKRENMELLNKLARELSDEVIFMSSEKRKTLHISAVFACNFVNHMYVIANEILDSKKIPFDVLKPLIQQTAKRIRKKAPIDSQTGPAVRYDQNIIEDHLAQLQGMHNFKELYESISKSIYQTNQRNK